VGARTSAQPRTGFPLSRQGQVNVAWLGACFVALQSFEFDRRKACSVQNHRSVMALQSGRSSVLLTKLEFQDLFALDLSFFAFYQS